MKKKITIVSGCYNERDNIREFHNRIEKAMREFPQYEYDIIIADNFSTDGTRDILREIASQNRNFKVILNASNFGHVKSPFNAFLNAKGDAVVCLCSDLQDPPELIADFIRKWEEGYRIVCAVKSKSKESFFMSSIRKIYYWLLDKLSSSKQIHNFTGFALYDRKAVEAIKKYKDPDPYVRGLICEIGFKRAEIEFVQPVRKHGKSKNNLFTLYDFAMTGFVNHTKVPLRLASFCGFCLAGVSLLIALGYLIYKLLYWQTFQLGLAPLVIGLFFFSAVQLIFIGIVGEYVGAVLTQVKNRPLVIEEERLNFDND